MSVTTSPDFGVQMEKDLFPRAIPRCEEMVVSCSLRKLQNQFAATEKYLGKVKVAKRGQTTLHEFTAEYVGGKWLIIGSGAINPGGKKVPNREAYPFSMDPLLNVNLKQVLEDLMTQYFALQNPQKFKPVQGAAAKPVAPAPKPASIPVQPRVTTPVKPSIPAPPVAPKPAAPVVSTPAPVKPVVTTTVQPERAEVKLSVALKPQINGEQVHLALDGRAIRGEDGALWAPINRIRAFEEQPRKWFDPDELENLAESFEEHDQAQPIMVIAVHDDPRIDWEIVDGERRWRAARDAGKDKIRIIITTAKNKADQHLQSVIANFNRQGHPPMEVSNAIQYQLDHGKKKPEALCGAFGKSVFWIYAHMRLQKLHPELQVLLDPPTPKKEQLRMVIAQLLVKAPIDKQRDLYRQILGMKSLTMQVVKAKELIAPFTKKGVGGKARPSKQVQIFIEGVNRMGAETSRAATLDVSVWHALVTHRRGEVPGIKRDLQKIQKDISLLLERIERAEGMF